MKIKIKHPVSYHIFPLVLLIIILLATLLFLWTSPWTAQLPSGWLPAHFPAYWIGAGIFFCGLFILLRKCIQKPTTNAFPYIDFAKDGVWLYTKQPPGKLFFPYQLTSFQLTCWVLVQESKKTEPLPVLDGFEMAFSYKEHTWKLTHWAGIHCLPKLLEQGKKFKLFSLQILNRQKETDFYDERSSQKLKEFIDFLQKQVENYRHYGCIFIMPDTNGSILKQSIVCFMVGILLINTTLFSFWHTAEASSSYLPILPVVFGLLSCWFLLFGLVSLWQFYRAQMAKVQLEEAKRKTNSLPR